jgi:hypothetical protein
MRDPTGGLIHEAKRSMRPFCRFASWSLEKMEVNPVSGPFPCSNRFTFPFTDGLSVFNKPIIVVDIKCIMTTIPSSRELEDEDEDNDDDDPKPLDLARHRHPLDESRHGQQYQQHHSCQQFQHQHHYPTTDHPHRHHPHPWTGRDGPSLAGCEYSFFFIWVCD